MTQTMTRAGKPLFFPSSYVVNKDGVIIPPAFDTLPAIVAAVAPHELALFTKRLVDAARKRRSQPRYRAVNKRRLQLAAMCIGRWLEEEGDADFERLDRQLSASAELRHAS